MRGLGSARHRSILSRRPWLRVQYAATCAAVLLACGTAVEPTPSTQATWHFAQPGAMSFDYPANWQAAQFEVLSSFSSLIVYLSSEQLHDPCQRTPNSISCSSPIGALPANGILVDWSRRSWIGWDFATVAGVPRVIGGRAAKVSHGVADEGCRAMGGEAEVIATIPDIPANLNWTEMRACLRGPALAEMQEQVEAMLASVVWAP